MSTELITIPAEAQTLASSAPGILESAQAITIATQDDAARASRVLGQVKATAKEIEDTRLAITRPIDAAKKVVMDFFRGPLETLAGAETVIKRKLGTWEQEQARLRAEEQRRREEEARKERERIEAEARKRQAEENARLAEQHRLEREAEEAAKAGDLKASLAAARAAEHLEEDAAAALATPAPLALPVVVPVAKVSTPGVSMRSNWKARVVDPAQVPRAFLVVDQAALDAQARATKGQGIIAGVEFFDDAVVVSRAS